MTRARHFLLCWAAAPALAMSMWLLQIGEAPRSAIMLQAITAVVGIAICIALTRMRSVSRVVDSQWLAMALTVSLFIPLMVGSENGIARWVVLGSVRLYLAPVVLPVALLLLGSPPRVPAIHAGTVIVTAIALVLQPDASQLTAFALAMLVLLAASKSHLLLRGALLAVLLCCVVVAWKIPDPLAPVRYVEGVFTLAAEVSTIALLAALIVAALPVMAFALIARTTRSTGALAVATYYAALLALAPLQVTPVPLLGFGAGPILGYFFVAGVIPTSRLYSNRLGVPPLR